MKKQIAEKLLVIIGSLLLLYLLWWRLRLGITRYFDVDEFAHLHWAHNLFIGQRPYTDFYYIFPPFFLYLLSFVWMIFPNPLTVVIEARVVMFLFFLLTAVVLFFLIRFRHISLISLIGVITFAFLPIPYDKMLEVRPDLPAVFFSLLGVYLLIRGISRIRERKVSAGIVSAVLSRSDPVFLLSGISYGIGLGLVPKTIFFLPPVLLVFIFLFLCSHATVHGSNSNARNNSGSGGKLILIWLIGLFIPLLVIAVAVIYYGNPVLALLLMTKIPSQASLFLSNIYNHSFYMAPSLFFHPNETYYGQGGFPLQYILNLVIWISASVWGIVRLVGFMAWEKKEDQARELLIGLSFIFNFWAFTQFFPLKHAQYLIGLVPFVVFYWSDMWNSLSNLAERKHLSILFPIGCIGLFVILYQATNSLNRPKLVWDNRQNSEDIEKMVKGIPKKSYVYDLSGQSLVFKDPYYICCVPYGQYMEVLPALPSLSESLARTDTRYVVNSRLETLPSDNWGYIREQYTENILDGLVLRKR